MNKEYIWGALGRRGTPKKLIPIIGAHLESVTILLQIIPCNGTAMEEDGKLVKNSGRGGALCSRSLWYSWPSCHVYNNIS